MARSFGISFTIGAKVAGTVGSAFASLSSKLQGTRQSLARANIEAKALSRTLELREKRDAMKSQVRASGGADPALLERYRRLNRAYVDAAKGAGVFGQSLDALRNRERQARESVANLTRSLDRYQAMSNRRDAMRMESQRRRDALGGLIGAGASALAMAAPLRVGLEFEASMSKVRAVSGATGADFENLKAQARELGATTVWSAKEAADSMTFLSMAGFKTNEIMASMPGMLSLASAGAMDLASTADIASNILSGFGFEAKKMDYVADVMAKTFTNSNTSIASLGESMKYCAPVAAQAGQSFEDLAAMIGKLGDAGMQGSMAGTGLSAIIGRLSAPPKSAATAMAQLGLKISDATGKMRPLPAVFKEIGEKTANMSEEQKIDYAKALFGANHFAKGLVLMEASVKGTLQDLSANIYESGYATKVAQDQTNNLSGDLKALNSASEEVAITIFDTVNPGLRKLTKFTTEVVQTTGAWIKENPRLTQGLFLIGGGLTALKVGAVTFTLLRSGAKSFGLGLAQMGSMATAPLASVTRGIGAVGRAFLKPWNFADKTASVRQGAGSMKASLDSLRNSASQTIARMRQLGPAGMAAATMNMTASGMARASRAGWNVLKGGIRGVGAAFKVAFGPMSLLMTGLSLGADYIIENWDKIAPYFTGLWDGVKNIFNKAMEWIQPAIDMVGGLFDKIGAAWDWLFGNDEEKEKKEEAKKKLDESKAAIEKLKAEAAESPLLKKALEQEAKANAASMPASGAAQPPMLTDFPEDDADEDEDIVLPPPPKKSNRTAAPASVNVQSAGQAPVSVQVDININQTGVPDQTFAQGVINALKSRQTEFEQIISNIVNQQARLAYGN